MHTQRIRSLACTFGIIALLIMLSSAALAQRKGSLEKRVQALEQQVRTMAAEQRVLEARIAVLEQLQLTPSPEKLRQGYVSASKSAIINRINNVCSNAYQYRIRPITMGGGGGSLLGFTIPKLMRATDADTLTATTYADSVVFVGTSKLGLGTVQGIMRDDGRMYRWVYTGDFE